MLEGAEDQAPRGAAGTAPGQQDPPPVTEAKEGGGGVGKMGFRAPTPPPAEQFSSRPYTHTPGLVFVTD